MESIVGATPDLLRIPRRYPCGKGVQTPQALGSLPSMTGHPPSHSVEPGPLKLEIHSGFESLSGIRQEWDLFVLEQTGDLYLTFDWCRVWWNYFGGDRELVVLVFRTEGRLVGILPFGIDRIFVGFGHLRVAKLLNSEYTACVLHPAVQKEWSEQIYQTALRILSIEKGCDLLSFGQVVEAFDSLDEFKNSVEDLGTSVRLISETASQVHCLFDLPQDFSSYFGSLKSKQRTNLRRRRKLIEEQFGQLSVLNLVTWDEIRMEFASFREMHDRYWRSQGQGGHFVDLVQGEEFTLELIRELAGRGGVCLQRVQAGDRIVGYQFLFYFGNKIHWRLTAREVGEEWGKLGVGVQALCLLVEDAIGKGMKTIEAGPGLYEYKSLMGGEYRQMRCLTVGRSFWLTNLKVAALRGIYRVVDVVYYKIWYQRLVKVLRLRRGAIWQYYLRCRL